MTLESVRRIIDEARQALVGKLPNPQDQIDAITYTLMYKFMSDIDDQSASLGGKRTFFSGDYEKYDWHELMRVDGQDQLILFREAIEKMSKNPSLPALFREIFSGAMLKFNDPRTLRLFLKEMDKFQHGHNDDLGDAYEYLLSIMSSQGGLGQFRTPRHIIEFIVNVVNPDKNDEIIDPACGTAGFLIEAYKHILARHDGKDESGKPNAEKRLTSTELDNIHGNFRGFDIDPTMIRTARVNMYLHGFKTPKIVEHDTLTSEDYWGDKYNVIFANPPFMTPKGGIQPHKKFGVSANRAEVLFVDYIASHLKPKGRAGFVVPEGIIFQSGTAYKTLRKNLVENSLVAVVSLPSGVFQPYSGVKTSVLFLDPELAQKNKEILFAKIESDGFSKGTQRKKIDKNDLPKALEIISYFQENGKLPEETDGISAQLVLKLEIAKSGEYNLSGDRYAVKEIVNSKYNLVELDEVAELKKGQAITKKDINPDGTIPVVAGGQQPAYYHNKANRQPDIITVSASGAYAGFVNYWTIPIFASDCSTIQSKDENVALTRYIYENLRFLQNKIYAFQTGGGQPHVYPKDLANIKIPLPPLAIQKEIVAKIETKQKAINAAHEVIKNLETERTYFDPRPRALREGWQMMKLGDVVKSVSEQWSPSQPPQTYVGLENIGSGTGRLMSTIDEKPKSNKSKFKVGDILFGRLRPNLNKAWIADFDGICSTDIVVFRPVDKLLAQYFMSWLQSKIVNTKILEGISGSRLPRVSTSHLLNLEIPISPKRIQQEYIAEYETEQKIISANRTLIDLMTTKIQNTLAEVWDE